MATDQSPTSPQPSSTVANSTSLGTSSWSYESFREGTTALPDPNLGWNTYGTGVENVGRNGQPEHIAVDAVGHDQLLIRIDAVGLCFSDVKLIRLGGDHPKLYGRDLKVEPTRLGHEAAVTVIAVGDNLAETYAPGDRLAIQPDIHVEGRSTAYGYTIPGGLIQYHLIGDEVLAGDDGAYVIPIADEVGYAAAALSEPWACVEAAYTQRRVLEPLAGGVMWILGNPDDDRAYTFSAGLDQPATIVLSDVSAIVRELVLAGMAEGTTVLDRPGLTAENFEVLSTEVTNGAGFDDIILLDPTSADLVSAAATQIAFRGRLNLVGEHPLDGKPSIDLGRLHYHYTAYVGSKGPDIAASYGEARNRADLLPHGTTVFIGAGGPMGQMHVQRALESATGPDKLICVDLDSHRLVILADMLSGLAEDQGRELIYINPTDSTESLEDLVSRVTDGRGADDAVVTVPVAPVMSDAAALLGPNGMLVLFAGIANGSLGPLNISDVYLHNAQFTGTSGSSIEDQRMVIDKAIAGTLSPAMSLAAVGGIEAGQAGVQAMLDGDFAGKIMIFPQLEGLPLQGLDDLARANPEIGALMADGKWTPAAEKLLFETYHAR